MPKRNSHPSSKYEHLFRESVRQNATRERFLSWYLVKKLKDSGIDASRHFETFEKHFLDALSSATGDNLSLELRTGDPSIDDADLSIQLTGTELEKSLQEFSSIVEKSLPEILEAWSKNAMKRVLSERSERLLELDLDRDAFERRLRLRWKEPLGLLDVELALAMELGEAYSHRLRRSRRRSKDIALVEALTRLQARACQVTGEIRALLHSGFADGGLSRWRTLHELAVVGMFIKQHGPETAQRFLEHADVDSIRGAKQYEQFAPLLGYSGLSLKQKRLNDERARELERKFGKAFLGDYGWAAGAFRNRAPTFAQIEAAVDLDHFRPFFRLASNAVHGGSKGTAFRIGLLRPASEDLLLAGPSNAGLDEAGRLAALSLAQITMALLMIKPNPDSVVWGRVLQDLAEMSEAQFAGVARRLERDHRRASRAS